MLAPTASLHQISRYNSNAATSHVADSLQLHTTHIEGAFGNDEGAKASEGGDLGITPLDDIEQRLELVHDDFDCALRSRSRTNTKNDGGRPILQVTSISGCFSID